MGIPQAIMIAVMTANVIIGFVFHNEPRTDKYNGWTTLIGCASRQQFWQPAASSVKKS